MESLSKELIINKQKVQTAERSRDREEVCNEYLLSICIATYKNYKVVKELIDEILLSDSEKIEIVVCDDSSKDGSVEKLRKIIDSRVCVYENEENLGSMMNFYSAMEHGKGKWIFYVNDRDNVDSFKIDALLNILNRFQEQNIAFAKCLPGGYGYKVFHSGIEAYTEFACRIDHPTGYIYRRDIWKKIKNRRVFFENQKYGDYPFTYICALMSRKHNCAIINGDICDFYRLRIDFSKVRSRFFNKRKDKKLWFTPEKQWKELCIGYMFSKNIIDNTILDAFVIKRYDEYLHRVLIEYKYNVTSPVHTIHYGIPISKNTVLIYLQAINGGLFLWEKTSALLRSEGKQTLIPQINDITVNMMKKFFKSVYLYMLTGEELYN